MNDDPDILIEIEAPASEATMVAETFGECEILTSRGFGGQDVIAIVTKPSVALFKKLAAWLFSGAGKGIKTKVKIGKTEISLEGYTAAEVENLMESPALLKVLREFPRNDGPRLPAIAPAPPAPDG
jgi:hypothetical protein